jgi:hypothetical protein
MLLADVAVSERDKRHLAALIFAGIGAIYGVESTAPSVQDVAGARDTMLGVSAGLGAVALYYLLHRTEGERMYDDFVVQMANPKTDKARLVANTERRLNDLADGKRRERRWTLIAGIVVTGLSIANLALYERLDQTSDQRSYHRTVFASGMLWGAGFILASTSPTTVEQMRELWTRDPGISRLPRVSVGIGPTHGGGFLSLESHF